MFNENKVYIFHNFILGTSAIGVMTMLAKTISKIRKLYSQDAENFDLIKSAARCLLEEVNIKDDTFPFPVVTLLTGMGFQLFRGHFENPDQSGVIIVDSRLPDQNVMFKTDRAVVVNMNDTIQHQRFTIAHELAHYIFDYDEESQPTYYKAAYLTSEHDNAIERRANRFAAEILMPENIFKREFESCKKSQKGAFSLPTTITTLSKFFGVPATAVRLRFNETGCTIPEQGA